VFNRDVGVTFVTRTAGSNVDVVDLSRGLDCRRTYRSTFVRPVIDLRLTGLLWRTINDPDLAEET